MLEDTHYDFSDPANDQIFVQSIKKLLNASDNGLLFLTNGSTNQTLFPDNRYDGKIESFLIFCYVVVAIIGFVTNISIIFVVLSSDKLLSQPCVFRVLSLLCSDVLMIFTCLPFTLLIVLWDSWNYGSIACKLIPFLQSVSIIVCTSTTAMISVDRLILVTRNSLRNRNNRLSLNVNKWISIRSETGFIWILALILSSPIPFFQDLIHIRLSSTTLLKKCVELWPSRQVKAVYLMVNMTFQFFLPAIILVMTYSLITKHLKESKANIKRFRIAASERERESTSSAANHIQNRLMIPHDVNGFLSPTPSITSTPDRNIPGRKTGTSRDSNRSISNRRDQQVSQTLISILLSFVIAWCPWNFFNFFLNHVDYSHTEAPQMHLTLAFLLLLAMTIIPVNAYLYGWINPSIRNRALELIRFTSTSSRESV